MKEELFIKNPSGKWERADLSAQSNIVLDYKNNLLGTIGVIQSSYSYTVSLPKTSKNMRIFQLCNLPSVVVVNGTKIIGEPFSVRYRKEGIDILGDAVGFLDSVTKEAFEISLSFGFLGAFSDWIENENKLNDLGDYNTFTRYDNNLTDYPSSGNIDDLPVIFKPYYDMGVQPNSNIARLLAVKASYLVEQIEKKVDCTFSFPENVAEQINHLAIPLTNKAITSRIIGKDLYIGNSLYITQNYHTICPITCNSFILNNNIEDVLSANSVSVNKISWDNETFDYVNLNVTAISTDKTQRLSCYISSKFSKELSNVIDGNGKGDFLIFSIDDSGNANLIDRRKDVITYVVASSVLSFNVYQDIHIDAIERGKYFFLISFPNTKNVFLDAKGDGTWGISSLDYDGLCSINSSLSDAESVGIIPLIPIKGNLPDISQVDFIQSLCDMFGVFPIINPIPKKDDETGKRTVEFVSIDTLFKNKVSRYVYGKKFNDWTDRLITDPNDIEISFSKEGYYQRNYLRYTKDDTVTGDYDGYFDTPDKRLEKEGDLIELPFAASDGDKIIMANEKKDDDGNLTYTFEDFEPRIMSVIKREDGKCGLTFDGLDFKTLLSKYYSRYIELVQDMYLITVTVELNALDLKNIDYTYPVYFKQFGRYFGIVEIQANSADDNCEVTLMRLSAG